MGDGSKTGLWASLKRPSAKYSLLTLLVVGFVLESSSGRLQYRDGSHQYPGFCIPCHEMRDTWSISEIQADSSITRTGPACGPSCSDCHVPKG